MNRVPPPLIMGAGLGLEWALSRYAPILLLNQSAVHWAGVALVVIGAMLGLTSVGLFARARTTVIPHAQPKVFVATGPYRFTRNPMYLALTTILIGGAAVFGGLSAFVVPFLFGALISSVFIRMEERHLVARFGEEYERYRRRVRRWI